MELLCHRCCSFSFLRAARWSSAPCTGNVKQGQTKQRSSLGANGESRSQFAYCSGLLLLQGMLIVGSLGLDMPLDVSVIGRSLGLLLAIISLLAINKMPKLPWFERRF